MSLAGIENRDTTIENRLLILDSILNSRFSRGSRIECQLTFKRYCTCNPLTQTLKKDWLQVFGNTVFFIGLHRWTRASCDWLMESKGNCQPIIACIVHTTLVPEVFLDFSPLCDSFLLLHGSFSLTQRKIKKNLWGPDMTTQTISQIFAPDVCLYFPVVHGVLNTLCSKFRL